MIDFIFDFIIPPLLLAFLLANAYALISVIAYLPECAP